MKTTKDKITDFDMFIKFKKIFLSYGILFLFILSIFFYLIYKISFIFSKIGQFLGFIFDKIGIVLIFLFSNIGYLLSLNYNLGVFILIPTIIFIFTNWALTRDYGITFNITNKKFKKECYEGKHNIGIAILETILFILIFTPFIIDWYMRYLGFTYIGYLYAILIPIMIINMITVIIWVNEDNKK